MKRLFSFALISLAACTPKPPAHWPAGGAAVEIPYARLVRGELVVELLPDGKVKVNGEHEATLDRAGRLFDVDAQPIALLEPDGRLVGPDDAPLGFVGQASTSLPGMRTAWIAMLPTGEVVRYEEDGTPASLGVWTGGCGMTPRTQQACMLITHVVASRAQSAPRFGVSVGVGVGVGIGGRR